MTTTTTTTRTITIFHRTFMFQLTKKQLNTWLPCTCDNSDLVRSTKQNQNLKVSAWSYKVELMKSKYESINTCMSSLLTIRKVNISMGSQVFLQYFGKRAKSLAVQKIAQILKILWERLQLHKLHKLGDNMFVIIWFAGINCIILWLQI